MASFNKLIHRYKGIDLKFKKRFNLAYSIYFKLWQMDFYRFLENFIWEYNLKYPTYWKKLEKIMFSKILDSEFLKISKFIDEFDNLLYQFYVYDILKMKYNNINKQ